MSNNKRHLVSHLISILPYPRAWFERLTEAQLVAIYYQRLTQKVEKEKEVIEQPKVIRKTQDGDQWILTEAHGWEIEIK